MIINVVTIKLARMAIKIVAIREIVGKKISCLGILFFGNYC